MPGTIFNFFPGEASFFFSLFTCTSAVTERKTNASVLEQLGVKAPQLLNLIKRQKLSYFGHIKRHNTLEKLFLEGTCEGRRDRGRPRRRWTQDIGEWMGVSTVEAGRQALERGEFRQAVWEATSIKDPP